MTRGSRYRKRASPPWAPRRKRGPRPVALAAAAIITGAIGGYLLFAVYPTALDGQGPLAAELARVRDFVVDTLNENGLGSCQIKGNVSYNTGERIYHVPGGEFYSRTRIDASRGERWFCTEAEARAAGWRRSRR